MKEYHKIQSVFLRDPATHHKTFLIGQYAEPAFEFLKNNIWEFTEKVDGTNVRVHWDGTKITLGGRTENAQMPLFLVERLWQLFNTANFVTHFPPSDYADVLLFGEGYGAKIQKGGGNYKADGVDFVLFDVAIGGTYLERHNVEDVAVKMGVSAVPVIGSGTLAEAIEMTQAGFQSRWGNFIAEGIVARPSCEMLDRRGHRIITKVKHKDFAQAK